MNRLRTVAWLEETECDVLIFDAVGSEEIQRCIPARARVNVLRIREGLPLIKSARFVPILLWSLLQHRKPGLALVVSIIRLWKPKVVITFIDNTRSIGALKKVFPSIRMISVQNGTRWDLSLPNQPRLDFDHYFSFGKVESEMFSKGGHSAAHVHPVGSLRAGFFAETFPEATSKTFDLCFISGFTLGTASDRQKNAIQSAYFETDHHLFRTVAQFADANNLSLCVAMRYPADTPAFEQERRYFSLDGRKNVQAIPRSPFSSYKAVRASRLSITISSSLGYEALGLGERVLFAKDLAPVAALVRSGSWTENLVTHRLPERQRLYSLDLEEFSLKAAALLAMTDHEYLDYSREARAYYMNIDPQHPPHEIIKNSIEEVLSRPSPL